MTKAEQQSFLERNLRDLQTPSESLWWPPAVGWWILAVVLMLLIGTLIYTYIRNRSSAKNNRHLNAITGQLDVCFDQWQTDHNAANYIQGVSALLKQSAVQYAGRNSVARLNGREWIEWMELETATTFSASTRALLGHGGYQKTPPSPDEQSHREIVAWNNRYTEIAQSTIRASSKSSGFRKAQSGLPANA